MATYPEYRGTPRNFTWQFLNQPLSVLKAACGITDGGSSNLTTTVTVTAAEVLAATTPGDTVKTLLPSPGAGKYLLVNVIVVKFKDATVAFDQSPAYGLTQFQGNFTLNFFGLGTTPDIAGYGNGVIAEVDQSLDLKFNAGTAPSAGDGNFIFEIEYQILDF